MSRAMRHWRRPAALALTAATALLSGLALAAYAGHDIRPYSGNTLGFSEPHDRRALALLAQQPHNLDRVDAETRRALRLAPYDNSARLRLLFTRVERTGRVDAAALSELSRSYDLVPIDHTVAPWRVRFALEHWAELNSDVRTSVKAEAMAFGRTRSQDADLRSALVGLRDPEGRIAAALWLRELRN